MTGVQTRGPGPSPPVVGPAGPLALVLGVHLVVLMGRFTLDRIGMDEWAEADLRLFALPVLLAAVLLWRFGPAAPDRRGVWPSPALWALGLFAWIATTGFWAPDGARTGDRLLDLVALALLLACLVVLAIGDPARVRRVLLVALLVTGVVYAAAGLLLGDTNVQGRTVAFGGGPNVFIRVVGLGLVAAVALAVVTRRKAFLLLVPLLAAAAVLSGSRGGLASIAVTGLVAVVLCRRRLSVRGVLAGIAAVPVLLGTVLVTAGPETVELLRRRLFEDLFVTDRFSGRPELFAETLGIFREHPLAGGGLDAYYVAFGRSEELSYPHNIVLEVAATGGVVGLVLLAGFTAAVVRAWRRIPAPSAEQVALLCGAVLIGVASMVSGDLYDTRLLWLLAVVAVLPPRVSSSTP